MQILGDGGTGGGQEGGEGMGGKVMSNPIIYQQNNNTIKL